MRRDKASRLISLPRELDDRFFKFFLGRVQTRKEILFLVEENLIQIKFLLQHVRHASQGKLSEEDCWFGYFQFLRKGLKFGHRAELYNLIDQDDRKIYRNSPPEYLPLESVYRLPPVLDEVIDLLDSYKSQMYLELPPRKEDNRTLYWILDSYKELLEDVNKNLEPGLFLEKLAIALTPSWGEIRSWW